MRTERNGMEKTMSFKCWNVPLDMANTKTRAGGKTLTGHCCTILFVFRTTKKKPQDDFHSLDTKSIMGTITSPIRFDLYQNACPVDMIWVIQHL